MLEKIERLNEGVWANKVTLATTAHALGGVGFGLLLYPEVKDHARTIGFALLGVSLAAHAYAFATMCSYLRAPTESEPHVT